MRTCEQCGKSFYVTPSAVTVRPSRWCSRECADIGRKRGERRSCVVCGTDFYCFPSQPRSYCSRACYYTRIGDHTRGTTKPAEMRARLSAAKTGKPQPWRVKPPVVVTCLECGETTTYSGRARYHAQKRRFCGTDCWYAYVRKHPEASGSFKGGYYPYYGSNWPSQAKSARERDGHTCQICGLHQYTPRLDVHHRRPRREFGENYEAMNALENLVSVCKACHTRLERGQPVA